MSASSTSLHSAIVGIETWLERLDGRAALEEAIYRGLTIAIDAGSVPELIPLCGKLVSGAIADAKVESGARVSVLGIDDASSSALLERLGADFRGASVSALGRGAGALVRALTLADQRLQSNEADAVIVLSVDLSCAAPKRRNGSAFVLVRREQLSATRRAYALLDAQAIQESTGVSSSADDVRWVAELALGEAGIEGRDVGLAELAATLPGYSPLTDIEGLTSALRSSEPSCALGSVAAGLGPTSAAMSLARAAFALQHRYLPNAAGLGRAGFQVEAPFYLPDESRPFFVQSGPRRAIAQITEGGTTASLVLREHTPAAPALPQYSPVGALTAVPITGDTSGALLKALEDCDARLAAGTSSQALAAELINTASGQRGAKLALALVGRDVESLRAEIRAARLGVPKAIASGIDWQTPVGSTFSPRPLGTEGKLAFVYPGAFSGYVGLARDAFRLFPWLFEPGHGLPRDLASTFADSLMYPRWPGAVSPEARLAAEARLMDDHIAAFGASAASAVLSSRVACDVFGLHTQIAFGYSLGEGSMFPALGAWNDPDLQRERLHSSPLFRTRLGGSRDALRSFWETRGVSVPPGPAPWATYVLRTSADNVRAALKGTPHVFLTIVNTPDEVVIGGLPEECVRLVADLHCDYLLVPYAQLLHCDVVATEEDEIARLHSYPTRDVPQTAFYSATSQTPLVLERESIARVIARMSREPLDFPQLVDRVWQAGARVFLELGAGSSCSRLIAANLQGRPHVTISMDRRGVDVQTSLIRCLARLFTHRVELDLSPLTSAGVAS